MKGMDANGRARNWVFIVYPESAPEDWKDQLASLGVAYVISPLHSKDKEPDGTPKKAHWHVLVAFGGKKSYEQVRLLTKMFNAPAPEVCQSTRGQVRYFLHLDNPDKAQYERSELVSGGGFDIEEALRLTTSETQVILDTIEAYCRDNGIIEYADLVDTAPSEWRATIRSHTFHLGAYLRSRRHIAEKYGIEQPKKPN